jgi:hypothetical protein
MENNPTDTFDWGPFGEPRWRELGAAAGCSEKQLRYAVAKFQGASQTAAARLAGYESGGDDDSGMRRAGYSAHRSTAVGNLLELATINSPESSAISDREIDAKIARLCRSQDSNISLKAIETFQKREAARKEAAAGDDDESPESLARLCMSLCRPSWVPVVWAELVLRLWQWQAPFLKDVAPYLAKHHPDDWRVYRALLSGEVNQMADDCDRLERGPLLSIDEILARAGAGPAALDPPKKRLANQTNRDINV